MMGFQLQRASEVRHFIEHRARHDAMAMGGDLVRCIQALGQVVEPSTVME